MQAPGIFELEAVVETKKTRYFILKSRRSILELKKSGLSAKLQIDSKGCVVRLLQLMYPFYLLLKFSADLKRIRWKLMTLRNNLFKT